VRRKALPPPSTIPKGGPGRSPLPPRYDQNHTTLQLCFLDKEEFGVPNAMLPAYPWQTRPDDHPLTADEVCAALFEAEGDVTSAAERLKVGSLILRKFIERSSRARAVIVEMNARLVDEAQATLHAALRDDDARRQDWATRFILNSKNGRGRGWASAEPADEAAQVRGPLINLTLPVVRWADGTLIGPPAQLPTPSPTADVER
jgi:hypothetical protein